MEHRVFDWVEHVSGDYSLKPDIGSYTHLRLFHGCRPIKVQSYYEKGICVIPIEELARQFRERFKDYDSETLDNAILKKSSRQEDKRVDTALDLRFLIRHASHYIVQGSETLKAFAACLKPIESVDPRERLKDVGIPTAVIIEAPISAIDNQTLQELDDVLAVLVTGGTNEACDDGNMIDFTVSFPHGVPREWIVGHELILEATDPEDRGKNYRYEGPDVH